MRKALVLCGGGVAGIAWEVGVLRGIEEVDAGLAASLLRADLIVGTSAGSAVGAQITSGRPLADLYDDQVRGASPEIAVDVPLDDLVARIGGAVAGASSGEEVRRRVGAMALETPTVSEAARRTVIEARLPEHHWPGRDLRIVAVDASTGSMVVFGPDSGVGLVDAVAASCAVPGVWPPVTIDGRRYIDGGVRSSSNVDLAAGCDRVLVLSPAAPDQPTLSGRTLAEEVARLGGSEMRIVHADGAATAAFGTNPLSPATRAPSAEAGRAQGRHHAGDLAGFWG